MTKQEIKTFTAWTKNVCMTRIAIEEVPVEYRVYVEHYRTTRAQDENDCVSYFCHHNAMVSVYSKMKRSVKKINNCGKCGGTGYIRAFAHIDRGICFACNAEKS